MNGGSWGFGRGGHGPGINQGLSGGVSMNGYQGMYRGVNGHSDGYLGRSGAGGVQHGLSSMNGMSRPASRDRERRSHRDRERERNRDESDDRDRDGREDEIISTIFVVGFPDDMGVSLSSSLISLAGLADKVGQEREFQNIFTFSPGFEAATLKFPSGSSRREPHAALLAELTQLAANQGQIPNEYGDIPLAPLEDALSALQMGGTTTTSTSTTPSAPMSLTPSVPSTAQFGPNPYNPLNPNRRQTIGFARFKTRPEALAAKEHLQGRKIDTLSGATLKAEMAKKNLHTKRTTSGEERMGLLLRSGRLAGLVNGQGHTQVGQGVNPYIGKEGWDNWQGQGQGQGELDRGYPYPPQGYSNQSQNIPIPYAHPGAPYDQPQPQTQTQPYRPPQTNSNSSQSPPNPSITSPTQRQDSKALLALAEEADELEGWDVSDYTNATNGYSRAGGIGAGSNTNPNNHTNNSIPNTNTHVQRPSISHSISNSLSSPIQHSGVIQAQGLRIDRERDREMGGFMSGVGGGVGGIGGGIGSGVGVGGFGSSPQGSEGLIGGNPADQNPPVSLASYFSWVFR